MKIVRLYPLFFFSLFLALFSNAHDEPVEKSANLNDRSLVRRADLAEISVKFLPGTAYLAYIYSRNSETGVLHNYGTYYVNSHWHTFLPVGSRFKITVLGAGKHCRFFTVVNPTHSHLEFWGSSDHSKFEHVAGDAVVLDDFYTTHAVYGCPDP